MGIWTPKVKLHEIFWHVFDLFDTINQMTLNIRMISKIVYLILHLRCILWCVDVYNVTYFYKYLFITHGSLLRICKCAIFLFNSKVSLMAPIILLGLVQFWGYHLPFTYLHQLYTILQVIHHLPFYCLSIWWFVGSISAFFIWKLKTLFTFYHLHHLSMISFTSILNEMGWGGASLGSSKVLIKVHWRWKCGRI